MKYGLRWHFEVTSPRSDTELGDHVDCVMQELLKLEECTPELSDAAIGLDADRGRVEIELTIAVDDLADAVGIGKTAIRTAVHTAGGYTEGWDERSAGVGYELVDVLLEPLAHVPA